MKKLDSPSYLSWGALLLLQLPALPVAAQWALASKASSPSLAYEGASSQARPAEVRTSLKDAVNQLKQQYHVRIAFQEGLLNGKFVAPTQADSVAASLEGSLRQLLPAAGLGFKRITAQQYVIYAAASAPAPGDHVRGQVTFAEDGTAVPGASVVLKGNPQVGTTSAADGSFDLNVPDSYQGQTLTLVVSFVGYTSVEVTVPNRDAPIAVKLAKSDQVLDEVVVTALNVSRERKTLGYSVTEIAGSSLTEARETNVANSLVGKVAGLSVNSTAGGPGSSSNVIIRGASSINQTNQPLYVINGIPVESQPSGGAGASVGNSGGQYDNAPDYGDPISNLNPDDIATISVLKGAAASALYGYRAKAGVILITTKSAKGNDGIEFNSNYVAQRAFNLTNWQYDYGQGFTNQKPTTAVAAAQAGNASWGGKLDGSPVIQFDGTTRPYSAQRDNIRNFYRTGQALTNTLAFNKSFTGGSIRLSASDLLNTAVVPNSRLDRQTFNLAATFDPFKRLTIDARANYVLEQAKNRPILADGAGNANFNVAFLPTSVDVRDLQGPNGNGTQANGNELSYNSGNVYATNPYFAAQQFVNNTRRDRLLSNISARYTLDNGLFLQGRVGRDAYNDRITSVTPSGTAYRPLGSLVEITSEYTDLNVDGLAGKAFKVGENFSFTPNVGASYRRTKQQGFQNFGNDFAIFGINQLSNTKTRAVLPTYYDLEVQSVYGSLDLSYKEFLFLTATVRRDWFSSLATPGVDNDLDSTYPGVSGSFVFSELWKSSFLSFGKVRAGYSRVGQATGPFQTQLNYALGSTTLNGVPYGGPADANIPNRNLRASSASELEVGTELAFAANRVRLDLTLYKKNSTGEIVNTPASGTSGYSGAVLNAGQMENKGVEMLLTILPVRSTKFTWTSSFNAAYNKNTVLSLAAGQTQSVYATSRSGVGFMGQQVGKPFGQVFAYDYAYNTDGSVALTPAGVPARGLLTAYGTAFHPWTMGWNNDFAVGRFNLGVLLDGKFGGKIFSATDYYATVFGLRKETLVNREGNFGTASAPLDAATYYGALANNVSNQFVQDASFIKLRQVTLGYSFPSAFFGNRLRGVTVSLVARNLLFLRRLTDNIDPEGSYNAFSQGLELGGVPPTRTFGLNLNAKF